MDIESLSSIDEIGDKTAKSIADFLVILINNKKFKSFGLNFYQVIMTFNQQIEW